MPIPVIAAMAALGLAKGLMDKGKEDKDRRQAAEMARWSPWTGMKPNDIRQSDVMGSTMQGGMTGAMMGQQGGWGGAGAAPEATGAAATTDPGAAASLTGGQSQMAGGNVGMGGYMSPADYNTSMAQKYPWLGMQ